MLELSSNQVTNGSLISMTDIEQKIRETFPGVIKPGFGVVIVLSNKNLVKYGNVEAVDSRDKDGFVLDLRCTGAKVISSQVYAVFMTKNNTEIKVERYREEKIFERINTAHN